MGVSARILKAFPPSVDALFERTRLGVDNFMLRDIAMADYGHKAEECYAELRVIRDRGTIPAPMDFQLIEVLHLTRWHDPERPNRPPFYPGPIGPSGYLTRLFACAVLLRAAEQPECGYRHDTYDSTLAMALCSTHRVGLEMDKVLARFLTWRLSRREREDESVCSTLGLLILALRQWPRGIEEHDLEQLADSLLELDARDIGRVYKLDRDNPRPAAFSVQQGFWKPLLSELRDNARAITSEEIRTKVELVTLLVDET